MKTTQLNTEAMSILAQTAGEVNTGAADFTALVRAYENAHASGADTAAILYRLATAVALSVLKKCIDPQRANAGERGAVSNSGINPALTALRRGILADIAYLEKLTAAHNAAYALRYNADGYIVRDVVDTADGWMERPCTLRQLSKKVLIRSDDSAKWEDTESTPIQEVYRAVRREVQNSRAMQTDPRNGYSYIEETAADPDSTATETIYRRLQKWADLGGYTNSGHYDAHGNASRGGLYTADAQTAADYAATLAALNLTERQATIVRLRMSGYGYAAIATYLGIREDNVRLTLRRLRSKCESIGFTWDMWHEMTADK